MQGHTAQRQQLRLAPWEQDTFQVSLPALPRISFCGVALFKALRADFILWGSSA